MSRHPAVAHAFDVGEYTDGAEVRWLRGTDGWIMQHNGDDIYLIRHTDMATIIKEENQ